MGWFDDDDSDDEGDHRGRSGRAGLGGAPPLLPLPGGGGGAGPAELSFPPPPPPSTRPNGDGRADDHGSGDEDEEVDPLDAYMSGLGNDDDEKAKKKRKAERLDVENEEEATAHWDEERPAGGVGSGFGGERGAAAEEAEAAAKASSGRLLMGRDGGGGFGSSFSSSSFTKPSSVSAASASSALAATFHRAGEKKSSEAARSVKSAIGAAGADEDDFDEDDLDALVKKRKNRAVDPLDAVDHGEVKYEPFRKKFLDPPVRTEGGERWRAENEVTCHPPSGACDPVLSFGELGTEENGEGRSGWAAGVFPPELSSAVSSAGYSAPTAVQSQTLPVALSGRDCLVTASTGSGKTLAYALPLVVHACDQRHIEPGIDGPIGLVLTPTRELAKQVHVQVKRMLRSLGGHVVCVTGGEGKYEMTKELKKGCEVVVSTPGRLIDMVKAKGGTNLRRVTIIVLDEADKMLDMGFEKQVTSVMENVRPDRQTLMFSATFGKKVERVARNWLNNPVRIAIGRTGTSSSHVDQHVLVLPNHEAKRAWLTEMLPTLAALGRMIVFVASRSDCEAVANVLRSSPAVGGAGLLVDSIHGDRHQSDRTAALNALRKGKLAALVATDVASRGLDVRGVSTVVNFDAAKNLDSHVHRVGRAGRLSGGEYGKGTAYTLLTPKNADFANLLVDAFRREGREVGDELVRLAMKSRHFGGGGGAGRARNKSGLGFHGEESGGGVGAGSRGGSSWKGGVDGGGGGTSGGGSYYGPAAGQRQGGAKKKSRWG